MSDGHSLYLYHLLGWALPVLVFQVGLVAWHHRSHFASLLRAILPPALLVTGWLVVADHFAIRAGIWRFDPESNLGIRVGSVPLEELLFFLLTNLLVAFGLTLFSGVRRAIR